MKRVYFQGGHRTASSALRLGQRGRQLRELHQRRLWTFTVEGSIAREARNADHALGLLVADGARMLEWCVTDHGKRLFLVLHTTPRFRTPRPKPGQTITNWRLAEY